MSIFKVVLKNNICSFEQKVLSAPIIFAHLRLSWSSGCGPCSGIEGP